MAWKGIKSLLETTRKIYRNFTTTAFRPRLATNDNQ